MTAARRHVVHPEQLQLEFILPERVIPGELPSSLVGAQVAEVVAFPEGLPVDAAPSTRALADDAARTRIASDLDATLFVEAGAGTGKTKALVDRVTELVMSGRAHLGEIAAITFTEAAAAELRARVGARLAELVLERVDDELLIAALGELDEAVITTIHGFAQRILADHLVRAGLPLRIEVLDDFAAELEFDRRHRSLFDELLDDDDGGELIAAALTLGLTPGQIEGFARQIDDAWDAHVEAANGVHSAPDVLHVAVHAGVLLVAEPLARACAFAPECLEANDGLGLKLAELEAAHRAAGELSDWLAELRWLVALPRARADGLGSNVRWSCDIGDVRDATGRYESARVAAIKRVADHVLTHLLARLARAAVEAAEERRRAGTLRFHDLLVFARDLLVGDPEVSVEVRRQFSQILVDEFQDTDALQLEIVHLIGGTALEDAGRLFFVGDPKQAIYRFRGADIGLYRRVRSEVASRDVVRLTTNFRSVPPIIAWVNRTFEPLIGEPQASLFETRDRAATVSEWIDLAPARVEIDGSRHPVTVLGGPLESLRANERRQLESEEVAATIAAAVREGWPVRDGEVVRPARFGDIALLIPSRTSLDGLEAALDALDISYKVQSSMLIYRSSEVRDLLSCLRALELPGEETAVVAALRTPAFACGDDDLAEYRRGGGQWRVDAIAPPDLEDHRVTAALTELRRLYLARHERGLVASLEAIVRERRVLQLAAGLKRRDEAWRRITRVLDDARAYVEAGGSSIAEFLAWTDHQGERVTRSSELVDPDEDAVSILTIHGAKGLEYPIVVLADLGARPFGARGPRVLTPPGGRSEARARVGLETTGFSALASSDDDAEGAEQLRLCYVAATRARDHLVVSLHHDPTSGRGSLAAQLWAACADDPSGFGRGVPPAATIRQIRRPPAAANDSLVASSVSIAAMRTARSLLLELNGRPSSVVASDLEMPNPTASASPRNRRLARASTATEDEHGERIGWHARRAATELGRAVHGVLQRVDLRLGEGLEALATVEARRHFVNEEQVANFARSAIATDIVREAVAAVTLQREMPVTARLGGGGVVEGIIDLLFVDDAGSIVVVDYKTDALERPEDVEGAALRYRLQVGAYALALERALGRPVGRCVLVFLAPPDGAISYSVADLPAVIRDAEEEIARRMHVEGVTVSSPRPEIVRGR